jgi:hypothetical protein
MEEEELGCGFLRRRPVAVLPVCTYKQYFGTSTRPRFRSTNSSQKQTEQKKELDVELKDHEYLATEQTIVRQMPYPVFVTPDSLSSSTNVDIQQTYPHHILSLEYEKPNEQLKIMPPRTSTQTS